MQVNWQKLPGDIATFVALVPGDFIDVAKLFADIGTRNLVALEADIMKIVADYPAAEQAGLAILYDLGLKTPPPPPATPPAPAPAKAQATKTEPAVKADPAKTTTSP